MPLPAYMKLFIDGRNAVYRALYAGHGNPGFMASGYHYAIIWFRFVASWIQRFKPSSVHVFWESGVPWRAKILAEYKEHRTHATDWDVKAALSEAETSIKAILPHTNVRQYARDGQEADDLIYTACKLSAPEDVLIVSSDGDFTQIAWAMPHVKCYEPRQDKMFEIPAFNPAIQKALMGDKSDNVRGYVGIGAVKSGMLASDKTALVSFLRQRGYETFRRNMALLDLSLCPMQLSNSVYVLQTMATDLQFDKDKISEAVQSNHVRGFISEFSRIMSPFKNLIE